jgi:acyl-CoA thioesterase YciA
MQIFAKVSYTYSNFIIFMIDKSDPAIRVSMMPSMTNAQGTIFGGVLLSYIDQAGAIEAVRRTNHRRFVTVAMREVVFHEPVYVGDLVSFYAAVTKTGNTSITVKICVESARFKDSREIVNVTEAEVIYVAVDEYFKKVQIPKS